MNVNVLAAYQVDVVFVPVHAYEMCCCKILHFTSWKITEIFHVYSERADSTGATGDRLKEGSAINKSLSTLGNCIKGKASCPEHGENLDENIWRIWHIYQCP